MNKRSSAWILIFVSFLLLGGTGVYYLINREVWINHKMDSKDFSNNTTIDKNFQNLLSDFLDPLIVSNDNCYVVPYLFVIIPPQSCWPCFVDHIHEIIEFTQYSTVNPIFICSHNHYRDLNILFRLNKLDSNQLIYDTSTLWNWITHNGGKFLIVVKTNKNSDFLPIIVNFPPENTKDILKQRINEK